MRGVPGSGKSYCANQFKERFESQPQHCTIYSTDDFWSQNGEYEFDAERLTEAHQWNQARAQRWFTEHQDDRDVLIIDNTNIKVEPDMPPDAAIPGVSPQDDVAE